MASSVYLEGFQFLSDAFDRDVSEEQINAWGKLLADDRIPAKEFVLVVKRWVETQAKFPTIAELRALAQRMRRGDQRAAGVPKSDLAERFLYAELHGLVVASRGGRDLDYQHPEQCIPLAQITLRLRDGTHRTFTIHELK